MRDPDTNPNKFDGTSVPPAPKSVIEVPFTKKRPILTREEEKELVHRAQAGCDESRNKLIAAHYLFVVKMARRYMMKGTPLPELIQEGIMGLIEGIERFSTEPGTRLLTYACWPIKRYIINSLERSSIFFARKRKYISLDIEVKNTGRPPVVSLDAHHDDGEESLSLGQTLEDPRQRPPVNIVGDDDTLEKVVRIMQTMRPRDRRVLMMRFGLNNYKPHTYDQIAKKLKVSQQRVLQVYARGMRALRANMQRDDM